MKFWYYGIKDNWIQGGDDMYQYFNCLVIREGTEGVPAESVETLFLDAGWARNTPDWQKEKFSLIFENSTWAYTVWDSE